MVVYSRVADARKIVSRLPICALQLVSIDARVGQLHRLGHSYPTSNKIPSEASLHPGAVYGARLRICTRYNITLPVPGMSYTYVTNHYEDQFRSVVRQKAKAIRKLFTRFANIITV